MGKLRLRILLGTLLSVFGLVIILWSCQFGLKQQAEIQSETPEKKTEGISNLMIDIPSLPSKNQ